MTIRTRNLTMVLLVLLYALLLWLGVRHARTTGRVLMLARAAILQQAIEQQRETAASHATKLTTQYKTYPLPTQPLPIFRFDSTLTAARPLPISVAGDTIQLRRMRSAAERGRTVVDLFAFDGEPHWLALAVDSSLQPPAAIGWLLPWRAPIIDGFSELRIELLVVGQLRDNADAAGALPVTLRETVLERELMWSGYVTSAGETELVAAIPVKDYEAWEVAGILLASEPAPGTIRLLAQTMGRPYALAALATLALCAVVVTARLRA